MAVLVVDDDSITQTIHKMLVKRQKLDVHVAENGKEAIKMATAGHNFNLILMDMEMPVMDGLEATKALRQLGFTCKIVGVTSRDEPSDIQAFIEAGADKCLVKPLNTDKLKSILEEMGSTSGTK
ncbi:unnamed protein product [Rhodiola kirilowii]